MRISDWSSDVCSSDLHRGAGCPGAVYGRPEDNREGVEVMRILVSNDDGIHAPGLKVLEKVARSLSKDVWVVAPEFEQSGASHSLTLTLPLRLRKTNARRYAVRGPPTDCCLLAQHELFRDTTTDPLQSGHHPR